jgi:GT2 family glycosyltransferase
VRLVELETNLGFAAACNRGVAAGTADVIVLLNNDVEVRSDFLEQLVAPFADGARLGSVAALLVRRDGRTIDSVGLAADRTLAGFARLAGRPVAEASAARPLLVGPSGGAAAYRRRAWEDVGGLDDRIFMYMEDLDLALRLRAAGWETAAAPSAVGLHLGSATIGAASAWTRYNGGWARGYLLRRYGVLRSRAALRAAATELLVVAGHLARSRDASAVRGRIAGWRAAGEEPPLRPPTAGIDDSIGLVDSLRLRVAP